MVDKIIIKRDGTTDIFNKKKLFHSLSRSGASSKLAEEISSEIYRSVKTNDTTDGIYKRAFGMLYERAKDTAMKYSLRRALFGFGPSGFPFEKFVAQIYKRMGYDTENNLIIRGKCAEHEVDVYAIEKKMLPGKKRIAMEVKFHNEINTKTDLKTLLYVKARFDDLKLNKGSKKVNTCVLITNTKFTSSAVRYAKCAGVEIIGWGDSTKKTINELIEKVNAHPITCLPSLKKNEQKKLFEEDITTCIQFIENEEKVRGLGIRNYDSIKKEAEILCVPSGRTL